MEERDRRRERVNIELTGSILSKLVKLLNLTGITGSYLTDERAH